MSARHVALLMHPTGLFRGKKLECKGSSLLERRSDDLFDANQDNKDEIEVIMHAAADLDDHDDCA